VKAADGTCYCDFCAKSQEEVRKLIAGPTVFICDECVALCQEICAGGSSIGPREAIPADFGFTINWRLPPDRADPAP
jgi:hypothetical protein